MSEYFRNFPSKKKLYTHELLSKLEEALSSKDAVLMEHLIVIIFYDGADESFSKILCKLLSEDWHNTHEDIISILEEIRDAGTVECIYKATFREAEAESSEDEPCPLIVKCLRALYAIHTPGAIENIKKFSTTQNLNVKQTVSLLLGD
jgi:hypothetical protein